MASTNSRSAPSCGDWLANWVASAKTEIVVEERAIPGGERKMLGFETISFAPIDRRLIEAKLLDREEIAWLDAYHAKTRQLLLPLVASEMLPVSSDTTIATES